MPRAKQMDLFPEATGRERADLLRALEQGTGLPLSLRLTRNRVSMAWIEFKPSGTVRVSLDEEFLRAPDTVIDAVVGYIRTRRRRHWKTVLAFTDGIRTEGRGRTRRRTLNARGAVHDLQDIRDEVNQAFFAGNVACGIGWGTGSRRRRRRRRSIRFGSWSDSTRTVTVHPLLDSTRVPREFVRYIVFHEMLHAVVPAERRNGRCLHHCARYRALETQFPNLAAMKRMSKELLHRL
jgi:hypothetical protein